MRKWRQWKRLFLGSVIASALLVPVGSHSANSQVTSGLSEVAAVRWPKDVWSNGALSGHTTVNACWENPTAANHPDRKLVEDTVQATWEAKAYYLHIDFDPSCDYTNTSYYPVPQSRPANLVRIRIRDEGPHVKALGRDLDNLADGMVLNFTFNSWSSSCSLATAGDAGRRVCIQNVAIHEWGHALGFTHEQNRTDSECVDKDQGSDPDRGLTIYDPNSVMNYCLSWDSTKVNPLSVGDISGVQRAYGHVYDVVAMEVTKHDQVVTWYSDGTASKGSNLDLGRDNPRYTYSLPPGKTPAMIRGIANNTSDQMVAYYSDGTMSVGTSWDLDKYQAPVKYTLAPGMSPNNIQDVAVSAYGNTYVWYQSGFTFTVSAGTATDLDSKRAPQTFTGAPNRDLWSIIGIGIGPSDDVRVWHGDLFASRGKYNDLDRLEGSFLYQLPDLMM